jgi:hypothetical protein
MQQSTIISLANKTHNNKYQYKIFKYKNNRSIIGIICPIHGLFHKSVISHIMGSGCPRCKGVSIIEIKWLDSLKISDKWRQFKIVANNNRYKVDGFNPNTNTIYEFYGDYYHGNPKIFDPKKHNIICHKTFGELYQKTIRRERELKLAGYNLITIWENDFRKQLKTSHKNN